MTKKFLTVLAVSVGVLAVFALGFFGMNTSTLAQSQNGFSRTLNVSGTGAVSAAPDVLQATLGVETQNPNLSDALAENNEKMASLLAQLSALGVDDLDVQTTDFFITELRDRDGEITAFLVVNSVRVTLRNLDTAGGILDQAIQAGANRVSGIQLTVSDAEPLLQQARALAVENARAKAQELADAAEMFLGSPVTISESGGFQPSVARAASLDAAESAVPLAAGELTITVNVSITYEMF